LLDECAKLLLSFGASVTAEDRSFEVPLHQAVRYGKTQVVKLLLPYYSDPLSFQDCEQQNALHLAARYGRVSAVELICSYIRVTNHVNDCLVENDINAISDQSCSCPVTYPRLEDLAFDGWTALHHGVVSSVPLVVRFLLNCSKSIVETPLPWETTTSENLLAGNPRRWDRPLHYALHNQSRLGEMYKVLVEGGADVHSLDSSGQTPLMVATELGTTEAIEFLLAHGATPPPTPTPSKKGRQSNKTNSKQVRESKTRKGLGKERKR
jgi:ankyrin repeat protein